jgi:hypothetical protein
MHAFSKWGWVVGLWLALQGMGAWAQDVNLGGVRFDVRTNLRGQPLVLQGAGIRYKAVFKVYAAGLYLPATLTTKPATAEEVLAVTGPRRMAITMLREIDSNELGKLFTRGVEDNMPRSDYAKLVPGLIRMGEVFAQNKRLVPGDAFTIDWVPGTGTVISVKGQPQGEPFKEPEFFNALLRIWLGKVPADYALKDALVGKAS